MDVKEDKDDTKKAAPKTKAISKSKKRRSKANKKGKNKQLKA